MTTVSNIEGELDAIGEELLGSLDAEERAQLSIRLAAAGDRDRLTQLQETAPTKTYEATDLDYTDELQRYASEALYALWELETGVWQFFYEKTAGELAEANYQRYPEEDWTEQPTPENEFHEADARTVATSFLVDYKAWKRHATADVGVSLEEFLTHVVTEEGQPHVARIEFTAEVVAEKGWSEDTMMVGEEEYSVEELVQRKYEKITAR